MRSNKLIESIKTDLHINRILENKYMDLIEGLPEGSLHCKTINKTKRYYHYSPNAPKCSANKLTYISDESELLLYELTKKLFAKKSLIFLRNNISAQENFLKKYKVCNLDTILNDMPPAHRELAKSVVENHLKMPNTPIWQQEVYQKNPYNPEGLIHRTQSGALVRSKSEAIILELLESYNVPYRYEAHLQLDGNNLYPDFTILSPRTHEIVYWEHFGMMDDPKYYASMERKLKIYRECNILQWVNLLVTFETQKCPLDGPTVKNIIRAFLLAD